MYNSRGRSDRPPVKLALLEMETEVEVNGCIWNIFFVLSYMIAVLAGIATNLTFRRFDRMFRPESFCPLFANFSEMRVVNGSILFWEPLTSSRTGCEFSQASSIICSIAGGIQGMIALIGLEELRTSCKFRLWIFLSNSIFFTMSIANCAVTFVGFSHLCSSINFFLGDDESMSCERALNLRWDGNSFEGSSFFDYVIIAQIGSAVSLIGWTIPLPLLAVRWFNSSGSSLEDQERPDDDIRDRFKRIRGQSESSQQGLLWAENDESRSTIFCPCRMLK